MAHTRISLLGELHKDSLPSTSAEENLMRSQGSDDNLFIESLIRTDLLDSMAVGILEGVEGDSCVAAGQ